MNQPVQLAGRRRAGVMAAMSQGLAAAVSPRISTKNYLFTLIDGDGVQIPMQLFDPNYGRFIDVVLIGANQHKSRIYYDKPYNPEIDMAPACWSDNGIGPSSQAITPQSATCSQCPKSVWGSAVSAKSNKGIPACSERKKLAVIVCNDPSKLLYSFVVPPASLKNVNPYLQEVAKHQITDAEGQRQADPGDIVTRIYFDPDPKHQGEMLFQPIGFHMQAYPYITDLIEQMDAAGEIDPVIGANDVVFSGALPPPTPVQQLAAPQPMPQMQAPPPAAPQQMREGHAVYQQPNQQFAPQPAGPAFGSPQPAQQFAPPAAGQANGSQPIAPPAPRTRRGGARAGAGRPPQQPEAAPTQAPFQQQAPQVQQPVPFGATLAGNFAPPPSPAPTAATTYPSNPGPVPFQAHAAPPVTGPIPTQAMPAGSPQMPEMPAFLQRQQPQGQPTFGMQQGAQPDPALSAMLDNAFGAPLQPRQR